jgi:hypothetical protein
MIVVIMTIMVLDLRARWTDILGDHAALAFFALLISLIGCQ